MFSKKVLSLLISTVALTSFSAHADEAINPEFAFIPEVGAHSSFQAQVGGGMLDSVVGNGTPILTLFKANYAPNDDVSLFIDLPMAGTWSSGNDNFGIGNITMGANGRLFQSGGTSVAFGANFTFPTSQNRAAVGASTRNFTSFVVDQYAISPYLNLKFSNEKFLISFDAGINEQIFSPTPAGGDKLETVAFYDAGLNMAINGPKDLWATLEFGGYSTITYANNQNVLFGGPGIRYQDNEVSYGLHLQAPFSSPARDVIDLLVLADVRFKY